VNASLSDTFDESAKGATRTCNRVSLLINDTATVVSGRDGGGPGHEPHVMPFSMVPQVEIVLLVSFTVSVPNFALVHTSR
jgi:hypothetical protein